MSTVHVILGKLMDSMSIKMLHFEKLDWLNDQDYSSHYTEIEQQTLVQFHVRVIKMALFAT